MSVLAPHLLEICLLALAVGAACWVRPWRLFALDSPYSLLPALLLLGTALPLLWWWQGPIGTLLCLLGANLALLALGWPLAVLLFAFTGVAGVLTGHADAGAAAAAAFWHGVLPATLGLLGGHAVRTAFGTRVMSYLLGRAFLLPLACTFGAAMAAQAMTGRFDALGADAAPALLMVALIDAMLTGVVATLLVAAQPTWLATWSDRLYLGARRPGESWTRSVRG
ncbi:hypothetical protein [Ramlibacter sp.]|uniref:hypothetical protein n=1 Tax=Ramlibacter sp. TaxID=1917967 RepID=UPI0018148A10|nr:hypothetical protein [Ramlibacter sp.]MBA2672184.1 hypothetical protein [Ramlibacter sp.]